VVVSSRRRPAGRWPAQPSLAGGEQARPAGTARETTTRTTTTTTTETTTESRRRGPIYKAPPADTSLKGNVETVKSPAPTGLADSADADAESASPGTSEVEKSRCFESGVSLVPDTATSVNQVYPSRIWNLTRLTATTGALPAPASEVVNGRARSRPAAQPAARSCKRVRRAERAKRATTSRRGCRRAPAASSPERSPGANRRPHEPGQPEARACPRPGSMTASDDRREEPHRRCGAVCGSRWSP
jgi:hypothetical protein